MVRPHFDSVWRAFPDHVQYPSMKDLYTWLGGSAEKNIYVSGFGPNGNTCASRLSVAFNKAGAKIDPALVHGKTLGTADGSRIIYAVAVFRQYLLTTLGRPSIDNASPYDDSFKGKRGIVAFSVNWHDATGHIALFNGSVYREPSHDNYAAYVNATDPKIRTSRGEFWELP